MKKLLLAAVLLAAATVQGQETPFIVQKSDLVTLKSPPAASGSAAPADAQYVTCLANGTLTAEVVVAAGGCTWLQAPTSANLLAFLTTKTGTGLAAFATGPTFTLGSVGNGATGPGCWSFLEDSDNGTNKIDLCGQASLANDRTITLPDYNGTIPLFDPTPAYYVFEDECDMIGTNSGLDSGCRFMDGQVSGTGAAIANGTNAGTAHPGTRKISGGTTITSGAWLSTATTAGNATVVAQAGYRAWFNIFVDPTASGSGGVENYTAYVGSVNIGTGVTNPNTGSGLYLSATDGTNSGNWVMNVCNAASCTTANSSTAVNNNAWRWYSIWVESTSSVHFYDCGATWPATGQAGCTEMANSPVTASLPGNFPTAAGIGPAIGIIRRTNASANRYIEVDYVKVLATGYAR